jgi:LPS O-antigen subunit length determinant protein (WzzB/FepE family)
MTQSPNDEIDLQELAIRILRYFRKHFWFIFLSSALGSIAGLVGYNLLPPAYESEMIVMSDILTESYSNRLTESLDRLIREENDSILSVRLGLRIEEAKQIKAIEIESIKQKVTSDSELEPSTFVITVATGRKELFPRLEEGIVNYLRNNEYVKTRVSQRERTYQQMIETLDQEIQSLDSLKTRLFQGKPIYAKSSEMMLVDPTNIYSKIIELHKQRIDNKNSLELYNSIQLIEGFTPFRKPASPKLSISLMTGFALGFFGALGILTFSKLWKMSKSAS